MDFNFIYLPEAVDLTFFWGFTFLELFDIINILLTVTQHSPEITNNTFKLNTWTGRWTKGRPSVFHLFKFEPGEDLDGVEPPSSCCKHNQRSPAVWDSEARLQPEPEAGKSTTAVENFLRDTSPKDPATQGFQQLQTGGVNIPPDEDARETGPCTPPPPGELIFRTRSSSPTSLASEWMTLSSTCYTDAFLTWKKLEAL